MTDLVFNGPADFNMEVFVVNDETEQVGKVTVGLGIFEYPSKEAVKERMEKFANEEIEQTIPGFRLMTKKEAWEHAMLEKTGTRFAMAGGNDWDEI